MAVHGNVNETLYGLLSVIFRASVLPLVRRSLLARLRTFFIATLLRSSLSPRASGATRTLTQRYTQLAFDTPFLP